MPTSIHKHTLTYKHTCSLVSQCTQFEISVDVGRGRRWWDNVGSAAHMYSWIRYEREDCACHNELDRPERQGCGAKTDTDETGHSVNNPCLRMTNHGNVSNHKHTIRSIWWQRETDTNRPDAGRANRSSVLKVTLFVYKGFFDCWTKIDQL